MQTAAEFSGITLQLRVPDLAAGRDFYAKLFGRPPDISPHDDFHEWEILPTVWLQLAQGAPLPAYPIRLGVADIAAKRLALMADFNIACDEVERIEQLAAWCNFLDPWGHRLGLYQDLANQPGRLQRAIVVRLAAQPVVPRLQKLPVAC